LHASAAFAADPSQAYHPLPNRFSMFDIQANLPAAATAAAEPSQEPSPPTVADPSSPMQIDGSRSQKTNRGVPFPSLWVKNVHGGFAVLRFERGELDGIATIGELSQAINRALQQTSDFNLRSKYNLFSGEQSSVEAVVIVREVNGLIRKISIDTVWTYQDAFYGTEVLGRSFENPVMIADASSSS
jgi:hypothetical protein